MQDGLGGGNTLVTRSRLLAVLGFALLEAWSQTLFSSRFALPLMAGSLPADVVHLAGTGAAIAGALGWYALGSCGRSMAERRDLLWGLAAVGSLSSCGLVALGVLGSGEGALYLLANAIVALCSLGLLVGWCETLAQEGPLFLVVSMGIAAVLGGLAYGLLNVAPLPVAVIAVALAPLASVVLLRDDPAVAGAEYRASAAIAQPGSLAPWLALIALASLAAGVILAADMEYQANGDGFSQLSDIVSRVAVMAAAATVAAGALGTGRMLGGFFIALVSMTAACLMMVFALHPFSGAASALVRLGSEAMRYLVLGLLVIRAAGDRRALERSLALAFAFQFAGTLAGQLVVVSLSGSHGFLGVVLLVDLVACAMAIMGGEASALRLRGSAICEDPVGGSGLDRFGRLFGLSPREREVLALWATGHASARIEEALGISKHTVKTHVQNIYAKTGVKTKQDLIDLYENEDRWR